MGKATEVMQPKGDRSHSGAEILILRHHLWMTRELPVWAISLHPDVTAQELRGSWED